MFRTGYRAKSIQGLTPPSSPQDSATSSPVRPGSRTLTPGRTGPNVSGTLLAPLALPMQGRHGRDFPLDNECYWALEKEGSEGRTPEDEQGAAGLSR